MPTYHILKDWQLRVINVVFFALFLIAAIYGMTTPRTHATSQKDTFNISAVGVGEDAVDVIDRKIADLVKEKREILSTRKKTCPYVRYTERTTKTNGKWSNARGVGPSGRDPRK